MNVSWSTTYDTTNLYLIQRGDFNSPVGIVQVDPDLRWALWIRLGYG